MYRGSRGDYTEDGENIVDMAMTFDLAIVYTFFENKVNHAVCDVQQWRKGKSDRRIDV